MRPALLREKTAASTGQGRREVLSATPSVPRADLLCVRTGSFSGIAPSLVKALRRQVREVEDLDLYSLSRNPRLLAARAAASLEASASGRSSWPKTAAWASANQRLVERTHDLRAVPTVVVQTVAAFVFPPSARYVVFSDRVGLEGRQQDTPYRSAFSAAWSRREAQMLRNAQQVLVMGPTTKTALVELYGLPEARVSVVGGAPNSRLTPARADRDPSRLLFVGTQWELKGGPELLEAFVILRRQRPGLRLTLVGSSPAGRLPEGVEALGRLPHEEMNRVYSQAGVLVLPTRSEAFGVAYVEALRMGLPCVGGDVANVPWIVGDAGVVVPPGDVDALVAGVNRVLDDYARYAARAAGRGDVQARQWSWEQVARTALDALQAS